MGSSCVFVARTALLCIVIHHFSFLPTRVILPLTIEGWFLCLPFFTFLSTRDYFVLSTSRSDFLISHRRWRAIHRGASIKPGLLIARWRSIDDGGNSTSTTIKH